jgi:hypothetical protein
MEASGLGNPSFPAVRFPVSLMCQASLIEMLRTGQDIHVMDVGSIGVFALSAISREVRDPVLRSRKRLDGAVKNDMMLDSETEWTAIVTGRR